MVRAPNERRAKRSGSSADVSCHAGGSFRQSNGFLGVGGMVLPCFFAAQAGIRGKYF